VVCVHSTEGDERAREIGCVSVWRERGETYKQGERQDEEGGTEGRRDGGTEGGTEGEREGGRE
jgi:hypothetical protein